MNDVARTHRGAVVTGGSSGIGKEVTARLRGAGTPVLVADLAPPADDEGPYARCDVTDPESCAAAIAEAEARFGVVDLVVLSAGVSMARNATPETMPLGEYRRMMAVNVDGVVFGVGAATPALRRAGGGSIVALASLAGIAPSSHAPLYTLTKTAVVGLVRALGPVLAEDSIVISAVCPSFTDTTMVDGLRERFARHGYPLVPVVEVAEAVLRAAGEASGGECYLVQAGRPTDVYRFRGVPGAVATPGGPALAVPPPD